LNLVQEPEVMSFDPQTRKPYPKNQTWGGLDHPLQRWDRLSMSACHPCCEIRIIDFDITAKLNTGDAYYTQVHITSDALQ